MAGAHHYPSVPSGSTPIVAEYFLTSDGSIVYGGNGVAQATNVASWGQMSTWGNQPQNAHNDARLPIKKTDGSFRIFKLQAEYATTGVPSGSTPAADAYFLAPDGRLVAGDDGSVLTTNVESFGRMLWDGSHWRWPLKKSDGSFTVIKDGAESAVTGIPSGSTPVVGGVFLAPDGRLIDSANSNTVYATAVSTTGQVLYYDWNGHWQMPLGIAETTPAYATTTRRQMPREHRSTLHPSPSRGSWRLTADSSTARADQFWPRALTRGASSSVGRTTIRTSHCARRTAPSPFSRTDLKPRAQGCHRVPFPSPVLVPFDRWATDSGNTGIVEATNVASCGEIYLGTDGKTYSPEKAGRYVHLPAGRHREPRVGCASRLTTDCLHVVPRDRRSADRWRHGRRACFQCGLGGPHLPLAQRPLVSPVEEAGRSLHVPRKCAETACQGIPSGSVPSRVRRARDQRSTDPGQQGSVEDDNVHSCGQIYLNTDGHTFLPLAIKKTSC